MRWSASSTGGDSLPEPAESRPPDARPVYVLPARRRRPEGEFHHRTDPPRQPELLLRALVRCRNRRVANPHRHRGLGGPRPHRAHRAQSGRRPGHRGQDQPPLQSRPGGLDRHGGRLHAGRGRRCRWRLLALRPYRPAPRTGGPQRPPYRLPRLSMIGQSGRSSPRQASTRWASSSCSDCSSRCFSAISSSRFAAMRFTSALDRCWSS